MSLLNTLTAIHEEHGTLTPVLLVELAKDPSHPLHGRIYDVPPKQAALRYYIENAARLLRVVKLPAEPGRPSDLRAFVAVKGAESHRAEYVPTEQAMADEFLRALVLRDMEREWKALKARYQHMQEFAVLVADSLGVSA